MFKMSSLFYNIFTVPTQLIVLIISFLQKDYIDSGDKNQLWLA